MGAKRRLESPHPVDLQAVAKALADPRRYQVLRELSDLDSETPLAQIRKRLPVSPATLSHHLRELEAAGLIVIRRLGNSAFLSLRRDTLKRYCESLQLI